jgi:5-methylthioadenosine/S-adenosylhomocysteine deaminase
VIRYVGPAAAAPPGDDYDLGDAILLPGLVNAHTHLELTAMRGFLEALPFEDWIDTLRRARTAVLDDAMLLDSARLGVLEGIEHGITTFADTCASGVVARAMRECGVRGIMYQEVFGPDPAVCDVAMAELDDRVQALRADATELVRIGVSPHAPYTVSDALYRAAAAYAATHALPLAMHIAEGVDEQALVTRGSGVFAERARQRGIAVLPRARSPIALLAELGVLRPDALLIHVVQADAQDVSTIAQHGGCVAHCPASNAKLGHGVAPLTQFIQAGIRVGLGSDSMASNNRMDMLDEARLALLMQNARSASAVAMSAQSALELATIGGARALGLDAVTGSLEVGKAADLTAFALDTHRRIPAEDPVATLIFTLGGARATLVAVGGRRLVEDGQLLMAPGTLRTRVNECGARLADWRAGTPAPPAPSPTAHPINYFTA